METDEKLHAPEPWFVGQFCKTDVDISVDGITSTIAECLNHKSLGRRDAEANAERIVLCVNALQGVPNKRLHQALAIGITDVSMGNLFSNRLEFQKQNKALLEALKAMVSLHDKMMAKVNHAESAYDAELIQEMNEAPLSARLIIRKVEKS